MASSSGRSVSVPQKSRSSAIIKALLIVALIVVVLARLAKKGGTAMDTPDADAEESVSGLEVYKAVRGQIADESTLVGVRLGWLIAAQAFLAAAYATALTVTKGASGPPANFVSKSQQIFTAIPIAGIALAILMGVSILAAVLAMSALRMNYRSFVKDNADKKVTPPLPGVTINPWIYWAGTIVPIAIPALTALAWYWILTTGSK